MYVPLDLPPWYWWSQAQSDVIRQGGDYIMQWVIAMPDNDFDATVDSWWRKVKQEKELRKQQQQQQHHHNSRYNIDTSHWQKRCSRGAAEVQAENVAAEVQQRCSRGAAKTHKEKQAKQQRKAKHVDVAEAAVWRSRFAEAKVQQRLEKQWVKQEQKEVLALLKADKKKAQDAQRFCEKERKALKRVEGSEEGLQ